MKQKTPFIIVLYFLVGFSCILQAQHTRQSDSLALVKLYQFTNGDSWTNNDNWLQTTIDQWHGVGLNDTGRVKSLHLPSNNLSGELPTDIMNLTALTSLVLRNNLLEGYIPPLHQLPISGFGPQDIVLAYNQYQFKDIAENTAAYNDSWSVEFSPKTVYSYVERSRNFSEDTTININSGATLTLSFNYKSYEDVHFIWYQNSNIVDTTNTPEYQISSYNDSSKISDWWCYIRRKNYVDNRYNDDPYQTSGIFRIISTQNTNANPEITLFKNAYNWKDQFIEDHYIRLYNEVYPELVLQGSDPETFKADLVYTIVKTPKHLQYRVQGYPYLYKGPFTGKENYTIEAYRKSEPYWKGKDTLVIQVEDNDGAVALDTFYFESLENDLVLKKPVVEDKQFEFTKTNLGIWIKWQYISSGIEHMSIDMYEKIYNDCALSGITPTLLFDTTLTIQHLSDSLFIPITGDTAEKNRDQMVIVYLGNRSNKQDAQGGTVFQIRNIENIQPYAGGQLYIFPRRREYYDDLQLFNEIESPCRRDLIHVLKNGAEIVEDNMPSIEGTPHNYIVEEGVEYGFYVTDRYGIFYTSDTTYVTLAPALPLFSGNLNWEVGCEKTVIKDSLIQDTVQRSVPVEYRWEVDPMQHYTVTQTDKNIHVSLSNPNWTGTDTLRIRVYNKTAVTDTFALISNSAVNTPIQISADTLYETLQNEWTTLSVFNYVDDPETPDEELAIHVLEGGFFRFKDQNHSIRPAVGVTGQDTVVLEVLDAACSKDNIVYIFTAKNELTEENTEPYIPGYSDGTGLYREFKEKFYYGPTLKPTNFDNVYIGGYFYPDVVGQYPVLDLKEYYQDDRPVEELNFSFEADTSGISVELEDGVLKVKPKEDLFYGFPETNSAGSIITPSFPIDIYAEDKDGAVSYYRVQMKIAERDFLPESAPEIHYHFCKGDTLIMDLLEGYREEHPILSEKVRDLYTQNLFFDYLAIENLPDKYIQATVQNKEMYYSVQENFEYKTAVFSDFDHSSTEELAEIYFHMYPTCEAAPVLNAVVPQQITYTQEANLNLWDQLVYSNGPNEVLWYLEGDENLNYNYNYQTGELNVKAKSPQWTGKDTLVVRVKDTKDREAELAIAFTTEEQEAPIIYLVPQNITIKQGETIPVIDLSNRVSDNKTLEEDIIWSVNSSISEVSGSIQNQELTLQVIDASWTGTSTIELIAEDEDGLTDTVTFTLKVDLETAINSFEDTGCDFQSYPNPVTQTLTVETCGAGITSSKIKLLNTQGQVQYVQTFSQAGAIQVDVSRLNGGLYILQLESPSGENKVVGKVMVDRP